MILDNFKLTGKVALVSGASVGLGQGMALGLAEAGCDIVGLDFGDLSDTKAKVEKMGRKFYSVHANLIATENIDKYIEEVYSHVKQVDIVVNNAGIIRREDILEFSEKDWDDVMNINIKAVFLISQKVAKRMAEAKTGGKIINIASMLSFQGGIRVPSYTSSKSAVKGLTMAMANELGQYGINVNAIAPGYMATDNTAALRADEKRNKEIVDRIPAGRWGTPEDLAGACVFLASKASDYINGYTIAVDGGWLSR